jgi:hypothetical protein
LPLLLAKPTKEAQQGIMPNTNDTFTITLPDGEPLTCRLNSELPDASEDLRATFVILRGKATAIEPGTYTVEFEGYEPTQAQIAPAGIDSRDYALDIGVAESSLVLKG